MKYGIMTIDDSRLEKKDAIRNTIQAFEEIQFICVNGRDPEQVERFRADNPWVKMSYSKDHKDIWTAKAGELGVWYSTINAWKWLSVRPGERLLVLEDDALLSPDFDERARILLDNVPDDMDFLTLFVPKNQKEDFYYVTPINEADGFPFLRFRVRIPGGADQWKINDVIARSYPNYSNVAMVYSSVGAQKLLAETAKRGIFTPVDCFVYQIGNLDHIHGYAPHPTFGDFVSVDWNAPTLIHETENAC